MGVSEILSSLNLCRVCGFKPCISWTSKMIGESYVTIKCTGCLNEGPKARVSEAASVMWNAQNAAD